MEYLKSLRYLKKLTSVHIKYTTVNDRGQCNTTYHTVIQNTTWYSLPRAILTIKLAAHHMNVCLLPHGI